MNAAPTALLPLRLGQPIQPESAVVQMLAKRLGGIDVAAVTQAGAGLIEGARGRGSSLFDVQTFLANFPINEPAGVALLRLAEAMPRVPDDSNQLALLADKLNAADWRNKDGSTMFATSLNAAMRLARATVPDAQAAAAQPDASKPIVGAAVVRPTAKAAIKKLGQQFVFAETVEDAMDAARHRPSRLTRYSLDMLGEGARTWHDAEQNLVSYRQALKALSESSAQQPTQDAWYDRDGLSIKISAIHPRYEAAQYGHEKERLFNMLLELCVTARDANIGLTIDAEESERLEIHFDLFTDLALHPQLLKWPGLGMALQAYQLRALTEVDALIALARRRIELGGAPLAVRLVKGAYWDAEVKRAQELGLEGYPVFTDKGHTDLSYAACAVTLLAATDALYPQFATHNAITLALIQTVVQTKRVNAQRFELQRLHGMGDSVHAAFAQLNPDIACRVYAPVGDQTQLLAYLIRRLLENGASTSFVRKLAQATLSPVNLARGELEGWIAPQGKPGQPLPATLFGAERTNAKGLDVTESATLTGLIQAVQQHSRQWTAAPLIDGKERSGAELNATVAHAAASRSTRIGTVYNASKADALDAISAARESFAAWRDTPAASRAAVLDRWADSMEQDMTQLVALCVWEAGKTYNDAVADVREAIDFCRYYAAQARKELSYPTPLPGVTGESNQLQLLGRGVFVAISPWNFPVAIFVGQVAAALVAGNTVVAKPAEQTPLAAMHLARRLVSALQAGAHSAGAFALVPGDGNVGAVLTSDPRIAGVVFTGSNATAKHIQRALCDHNSAIVPLIAETGGQNAMVVDSTALPEQVVDAVIQSAFRSAGQRCSALRVLCLQADTADNVLNMIRGAMHCLHLGDPTDPQHDIGPVIDDEAAAALEAHIANMKQRGFKVERLEVAPALSNEHYVAPTIIEINDIQDIGGERFGPVLHVLRYERDEMRALIEQINGTGFGLTFGIHTRIDARAQWLAHMSGAGNVYVNRNMIGAVVGSQPFGGAGMSGTGPKAGGPHYLHRFMTEKVVTINTAAAGGNLALLAG